MTVLDWQIKYDDGGLTKLYPKSEPFPERTWYWVEPDTLQSDPEYHTYVNGKRGPRGAAPAPAVFLLGEARNN